jgi:hypothetical protein
VTPGLDEISALVDQLAAAERYFELVRAFYRRTGGSADNLMAATLRQFISYRRHGEHDRGRSG